MINKEELMNRILLLEPDLTQALLELISDYEMKMIKLEKQDKILEILKKAYTNHIWSLYADTYELASSGFYRKMEITQEQSHLFEEWLNGR